MKPIYFETTAPTVIGNEEACREYERANNVKLKAITLNDWQDIPKDYKGLTDENDSIENDSMPAGIPGALDNNDGITVSIHFRVVRNDAAHQPARPTIAQEMNANIIAQAMRDLRDIGSLRAGFSKDKFSRLQEANIMAAISVLTPTDLHNLLSDLASNKEFRRWRAIEYLQPSVFTQIAEYATGKAETYPPYNVKAKK